MVEIGEGSQMLRASKVAGLSFLILLIGQAARGAGITPEAVKNSIDKGKEYLFKQQRPDGSWPEYRQQPTAETALVVLALLNSGEAAKNPKIAAALEIGRASCRER